MCYPVISQFLLNAIFRCATDKSAAPQLLVIVIVAEVVALLSTKLVKISTNAVTPSWQLAKPTVRANTIWQRSRELQVAANPDPKSVPTLVVIPTVESAGTDCRDIQVPNIFDMFVTDVVTNNGTDSRV